MTNWVYPQLTVGAAASGWAAMVPGEELLDDPAIEFSDVGDVGVVVVKLHREQFEDVASVLDPVDGRGVVARV